MIDLLVADAPARAVDVGCGTGKAARAVAARGVDVVGVEPDPRMAEVARRLGLEVEVTPFEAWRPQRCDLLYAAQAWHWVDPEIGASKAADALRSGGRWAAFWNREHDPTLHVTLRTVYERLAPALVGDHPAGSDGELVERVVGGIDATSAFGAVTIHEVPWVEHLPASAFVERLMTHSSHRLLDGPTAAAVRAGLVEALGGAVAMIEVPYRTFALVADRR